MTTSDLVTRWRADAVLLRGYGAEPLAQAAERHAAELEAALRSSDAEVLTLQSAASESGYSPRRLREMVSAGTLPNLGKKGSPRFRRSDLPKKARRQDQGEFDTQSAATRIAGGR